MGDRNPKSRAYTDGFPRRSGSLLLYNGATQWPMEADGDGNGQQYSTAPIWKCRAGIGVHRITFPIDLLPNYTFFTNLTIFSIGWLLMEDVTSLLTLWKVCSIVWCRFNRIARSRPNEKNASEFKIKLKPRNRNASGIQIKSKLRKVSLANHIHFCWRIVQCILFSTQQWPIWATKSRWNLI